MPKAKRARAKSEDRGFEKDAPRLHTINTKPKVIVGGNKPRVSRPFYDVKKVFKTN